MAGVLRVIRHMREYRVHNNNNTSRLPARVPFVFFSSHLSEQLDAVDNGCRQRHGAARRRQRRPRQFLRHERLSVAMALAESQHHTSRGQKMARAGEEGHEEHDALTEVLQPLRRRAWREAARVGHGLCAAGLCGTLASTSVGSVPTFRLSTCLCRRWGIRWWRRCGISMCRLSGGLSRCP